MIRRTVALLAAVALLTTGLPGSTPTVGAGGINAALCTSTPDRIGVPQGLGFDTCFDGARLYVKSTLDVVARITATGDAKIYARVPDGSSLLSLSSAATFPDLTILLPDSTVVFDIGSGEAGISLATDDTADLRYTIQKIVLAVLPAGTLHDASTALGALIDQLIASGPHYRECLARNGTLGDIGCNAAAAYDVANSLTVFASALGLGGFTDLPGIVDKLVGVQALDTDALSAAYRHAADLDAWNTSRKALTLSAAGSPATDPPPSTAAAPTSTPARGSTTTTAVGATTTQDSSTLGTLPPKQPNQPLAIGSPFTDTCVIAYPTAPQIGVDSIQMTTTCTGQPPKYLFVEILYGDPNLAVSPTHPTIHVTGAVVDIVTSRYGYTTLVVQADTVTVE
ncbi:MAG: hydrolase family protein [Ilumatobacteraceae bacterium]|nr:hydrolase family protein [Ilumatobacteraceae bacterium]